MEALEGSRYLQGLARSYADDALMEHPSFHLIHHDIDVYNVHNAIAVIVVSEIGDKTFLLAAIMAMRHPRIIVLCGAFSALAVMSLLSAVLGHILPALLPRRYTTVAAAGLFFVFGGMMLKEGLEMPSGSEKIQEELREVQKEVEDAEEKTSSTTSTARRLEEAEEGNILSPIIQSLASPTSSSSRISLTNRRGHSRGESKDKDFKASVSNVTQLFIHPILAQTFFMTFLAEWGDRSQISTIALAAAHNVYVVTVGTILGHFTCTAIAVLGGRYLASKISIKNVTLGGAVLFLVFGLAYMYEAYTWDEAAVAAEDALGSRR
ncbi:MAG: hypothetical protein CYPHOPRED_002444 [Cyphobasidiales sp. Tagirdzhanova-0007]|nr:MAG: hypothetical protein CYPHOPRED_002444 [Cyphobasidiales sp. Tagirdzhanova-0007]